MSSASSFSFGDGVLIPFPFCYQSGTKKRPAVVVSRRELPRQPARHPDHGDHESGASATGLRSGDVGDWRAAGLVKTSVLDPVFTTIEQPLVLRVMGHLSASDTKTLCAVITAVIG